MYTYDERGNVLTESDGTSVKSYTYNEFDGRASYTLKVNNVAIASETYAYDAARQLASVTTDSVKVTYGYDMNGNRITDRTINPTTGLEMSGHNYSFDGAHRVTQVQGMMLVNNGASFIIPVNEVYAYNLDGSMLSKTDRNTSVTTSYSYDGAGRLTYEVEGTAITTYAYDAANNRTSMYKDGVTTTYTYDANNRLLTEVKGSQTTRYTYDANGNQLSGNGLITYDARGRQSTWTDGLTTASYTYYPTDLRKSKTVGAATTNFVWDGQNMVYEYKGSNTTGGTAYYYGLTLISQGNYAYYLYNGHGDVVQLVTASNTLGRSYDYDAFGNEVSPSASDTNPFRYAGQYFDSETGTYYLRARYYDPGIGRFTQQDGWAYADTGDSLSLIL